MSNWRREALGLKGNIEMVFLSTNEKLSDCKFSLIFLIPKLFRSTRSYLNSRFQEANEYNP